MEMVKAAEAGLVNHVAVQHDSETSCDIVEIHSIKVDHRRLAGLTRWSEARGATGFPRGRLKFGKTFCSTAVVLSRIDPFGTAILLFKRLDLEAPFIDK